MKFKMAVSLNAVLIIGVIVLLATTVIFLILYVNQLGNRVSPSQCPKVLGNYGVTPNVAYTDIKFQYLCSAVPDGTLGSSLCSFTGVNDVYAGQNICNLYTIDVCGGFFYDVEQKTISFLPNGFTYTSQTETISSNGDVYLRQN